MKNSFRFNRQLSIHHNVAKIIQLFPIHSREKMYVHFNLDAGANESSLVLIIILSKASFDNNSE